jgi:two-component system response regulator DesR
VLDLNMPGEVSSLDAIPRVADASPGTRVVVLTMQEDPEVARRALQAGAAGFVVKDTPAAQLADAVRRVHAGLRVVDPSLATESLVDGANPLTEREREVLAVALRGGTVAAIAAVVHLSQGTVRNHLSSAIGKTGTSTRAEAARVAQDRGWL